MKKPHRSRSRASRSKDDSMDDDDNLSCSSSSSLSEESVRLEDATRRGSPQGMNVDGVRTGSGHHSTSSASFDISTVSLDKTTTDDEFDIDLELAAGGGNDAAALRASTNSTFLPDVSATSASPAQEALFLQELQALRWRRVAVTLAFVLSMAATGVGSYLYFHGNALVPEPDQEWLYPIILVAFYLLPVLMVLWYDYQSRRVMDKLRKTAINNAAIVNSLFPENVRSRMLKAESRKIQQERRRRRHKNKQRHNSSSRDDASRGSVGDQGSTTGRNTLDGNGSIMGMLSLTSREQRRQRNKECRKMKLQNRRRRRRRRDGAGGDADDAAADATSPTTTTASKDGRGEDGGLGSPANQTLVTVVTDATTIGTTSVSGSAHNDDANDDALLPKDILTNKPIADFFPHCTVLFADIVGFTAWSSVREPTAVFTLLESLYSCFDGIARRLGVFKVETIGDCYVATTGLPEPMKDHAIIMAQFARFCMSKMTRIVRALEKYLGPDTAELSMRFGLHSGPVTAGVMRGEKSRFQLFGDTVNTAARMESTGMRDKVHLSAETANELILAGKQHWVQLRDTKVEAKGKGQLQTYWLILSPSSSTDTTNNARSIIGNSSSTSLNLLGSKPSSEDDLVPSSYKVPRSFGGGVNGLVAMFEKVEKQNTLGDRTRRQADYTVKLLTGILQKMVAHRRGIHGLATVTPTPLELEVFANQEKTFWAQLQSITPLKEIGESIDFASFASAPRSPMVHADKLQLPKAVLDQLEDFVTTIAAKYQSHSFHSWEHASHVTISLTKLYSRLASATKTPMETSIPSSQPKGKRRIMNNKNKASKTKEPATTTNLNDPSFGILKDPLTEFALVFAAMIHDVDHPGISNAKIIKENSDITKKHGKRSPLEQHSLETAWTIFQRPAYQELRRHIYSTETEMKRFRQLVVTLVMATDIQDREAVREREKRWDQAFSSKKNTSNSKNEADVMNQRATLVLETMMQVANIAHCTQHWNVFTKWNKRLFEEMSVAYSKGGKAMGSKDPADFWYQGEIVFFDETVIPLCTKLHESGAFGEDAEEFVNYAKSNRQAWHSKGNDMVSQYQADVGGSYNANTNGKQSWNNSISSVSLWSSDEPVKVRSQRQLGKPASFTQQRGTTGTTVARWPPPPKPPSS